MKRKIIKIDESKCNGCELCVKACHENAIGMVDGVAKLLRDDYCDGLGDCLPVCPTGAISFEEREALEYDSVAVQKNMLKKESSPLPCGCPGSNAKTIMRNSEKATKVDEKFFEQRSELCQWPVQIKLVPVNAPYFEDANLLIAADCTAYAYASFHEKFMRGKVTLIGCPKLDNVDYADKLTSIITNNNIRTVTVVRMEVPCCGGIVEGVKDALFASKKVLPFSIVTISTDGRVLE